MAALLQRTIDAIARNQSELLNSWKSDLQSLGGYHNVRPEELAQQSTDFIRLLSGSLSGGNSADITASAWDGMRLYLETLSRSRAVLGLDSQQTAGFIFAAKRPLMSLLQSEYANEPAVFAEQLWAVSDLIDNLGLHTVRAFQRSREEVIKRQQEELLELSTPVVKLWDGVLALPMIGTLDSQRTQVVMESLLQRIVDTGSEIAIIDITGVPTVDTLVAQHLLKTVTAIRLMGADCIISGVRPQIAQTIVHLGLDLQGIVTKASLADALALALRRSGLTVTKAV
ncbi:STAS domain-containing protein [Pseudomonas stutzeri]|uniref:Polyvinylalcohol dehydrogenase n=1 Tax=Stutzerimonas stutzeri TaxID=316 RepID=A0A2N8RYM5_STUST|nr:STAS domain-containing protein [Stutzerimonas stutzeri]MCQ4295906.1 STAS domain-containing protein [Stutzerimonas stutzeri]PNF79494.1 polyvinylalcohol dehydrogenase [Stutzerimonas stutzeri]